MSLLYVIMNDFTSFVSIQRNKTIDHYVADQDNARFTQLSQRNLTRRESHELIDRRGKSS